MSSKLYNLIMFPDSECWLENNQYVDLEKDRFLEHTVDDIKKQFQELDQETINRLKDLPTLFAVEREYGETRIGKITDIEVRPKKLRIKFQFEKDHLPLTRGVLQQNWEKLNINKPDREFYRTHWAIKECDISVFYEEYKKTLTGIAQQLKGSQKKVQLIYAFNGVGKTRLSKEFKELIDPKAEREDGKIKFLYYNAFTEDLFYWDNDLNADTNRKLIIRPNNFTNLALGFLKDQGLDNNIVNNFQYFTSNTITPVFNEEYTTQDKNGDDIVIKAYSEVTFSIASGDDQNFQNIKISKGEESNFIWSIFYSLLEQIIEERNISNPSDRATPDFNDLEYIFIDDPVSSLDDTHLIELTVDIAKLIKSNESNLKFIITTHNPLFYNVISNELNNKEPNKNKTLTLPSGEEKKWIYKSGESIKYHFKKQSDGKYNLTDLDRKTPFSYHLFLLSEIKKAIANSDIKKFHFAFFRNILEKTSTFLGHPKWQKLLPEIDGAPDPFANRILNLSSHSSHAGEEISEVQENDKEKLSKLIKFLETEYKFCKKNESNDTN